MNINDLKTIDDIIHELTSIGQCFHSYEQLLCNEGFKISPKKLKEICCRCAKRSLELRNIVINKIKTEEKIEKKEATNGVTNQ